MNADQSVHNSQKVTNHRSQVTKFTRGLWYQIFGRGDFSKHILRSFYLRATYRAASARYKTATAVLTYRTNDELPTPLKSGLRRYSIATARMKVANDWITGPIGTALFGLTILANIGLAAQLDIWQKVPYPLFAAAGGVFGVVYLGLGTSIFLQEPLASLSPFAFAAAAYAGAIYLIDPHLQNPRFSLTHKTFPNFGGSLAYALLVGATMLITSWIAVSAVSLIEFLVLGRTRRRYAYVSLLDELINLRRVLMEHPVNLSDPGFNNYTCRCLEAAAKKLQYDLPRSIVTLSPYAKAQLQLHCKLAANQLRAMQVQLVLSGSGTLEDLRAETFIYVEAIATGQYGDLPVCDQEVQLGKLKRLTIIGKEIIVALVPLVILFLLRYFKLSFSAGFENWAIVAAVIWALVGFISMLDPHYRSRISDVQTVISMLRGRQ